MAAAVQKAIGRRVRSLSIARFQIMAIAWANSLRQSLGGSVQILTPGKVREMFHPDWTIHDRRLAETLGFAARYTLDQGFAETIRWYRERHWL